MQRDLIIGDADGVTAVPFARIPEVLESVHAVIAREEHALSTLAGGGTLSKVYGVPEVVLIK